MLGFDAATPNAARIYDFLLGGKNNFAADREAAEKLMRILPDAMSAACENRKFLRRAVRFLAAEAGIRQFIDVGAGLPTAVNTHEAARESEPAARTAYVDHDQVVVSHARALLATDQGVAAICGDLRDPQGILDDPRLRAVVNFAEPVAVMLGAVLHFLDDAPARAAVSHLKGAIPPGSYVVISHFSAERVGDRESREAQEVYLKAGTPILPRASEEIRLFFDGLEMVDPGVVGVAEWRPELGRTSPRNIIYGGAARKPG